MALPIAAQQSRLEALTGVQCNQLQLGAYKVSHKWHKLFQALVMPFACIRAQSQEVTCQHLALRQAAVYLFVHGFTH